jgi:glycerophosphoryl diester phosphodiesterase
MPRMQTTRRLIITMLRSSPDPAGIGDLTTEIRQFFALGVDGVFTDNPDIGVAARDE